MGIGVRLRDRHKEIIDPIYHALFNHKDSAYLLKDCIEKIKGIEIENTVWTRLYVTDLRKLKQLLKESGMEHYTYSSFYKLIGFWVDMYYAYTKYDRPEDYIDIEFNW